jgi:amino acid ABC transporter membrane protein 1, PAAT family (TC 3.A.1.3.-)
VLRRLRHRSVPWAILAIPKGHREAGLALGLSQGRILSRIILPQMWRIALPGLATCS